MLLSDGLSHHIDNAQAESYDEFICDHLKENYMVCLFNYIDFNSMKETKGSFACGSIQNP